MERTRHRRALDIEVLMLRFIKAIVVGGLLAPLALSTQGCADNDTLLFIRGVQKLSAGQCVAKADANADLLAGGILDTHFTTEYRGELLVGNQLVRRGSKNLLRTESNRVVLKGVEVTIYDDQENQIGESFSQPGVGFVDVGTGEDPGYGVISATLIPNGFLDPNGPDSLYLVEVRAFGETLGGAEVTSAALRFPVYTCNGCLISYPPDAADPAQLPTYVCLGTDAPEDDQPCRIGQDDYIDCRHCAATDPLCQSP